MRDVVPVMFMLTKMDDRFKIVSYIKEFQGLYVFSVKRNSGIRLFIAYSCYGSSVFWTGLIGVGF